MCEAQKKLIHGLDGVGETEAKEAQGGAGRRGLLGFPPFFFSFRKGKGKWSDINRACSPFNLPFLFFFLRIATANFFYGEKFCCSKILELSPLSSELRFSFLLL